MKLMTWKRAIDFSIEYEGGTVINSHTYLEPKGTYMVYDVTYMDADDKKCLDTYKITDDEIVNVVTVRD